jgi:hypothetical protein
MEENQNQSKQEEISQDKTAASNNQNLNTAELPIGIELQKKSSMGTYFKMASVVILVVLGGVFGYLFYNNQVNKNSGIISATPTPSGNVLPSITPTETQNVFGCKNPGPILASKSGMVTWLKPEDINLNLFATSSADIIGIQENSSVVGHFVSGKYAGADLLNTTLLIEYEGPGSPALTFLIIKNQNNFVLLKKYSDVFPDISEIKTLGQLTTDDSFDISDLNFPDKFSVSNPNASFSLASRFPFAPSKSTFCGDNLVKVFSTLELGDVYTEDQSSYTNANGYVIRSKNAFYVKSPDGSQISYSLDIPISGQDGVSIVTWNDGKKNTFEYAFQALGGCGASNYRDIAEINESVLNKTGTAIDGSQVFEYKDLNNTELQDSYEGIYVPEGETKISYAKFVASHPIFFWKDPFGKLIRFSTKQYMSGAECGKPVIYLYPTVTQKVFVQVSPAGGMSKSEPLYGNGWTVVADPFSNIKNLTDGKTYPYLFWEGRGGMYETPKKGFVVKKDDVHKLLEEKLSLLGLNEIERKDFQEFWEPKMQSAPYYFVTFMGNNVMDVLAPLNINPKPDTIIRVLMDFKPLLEPETVEGYNINTPKRKGFTVVEWGGVLR